MSNVTNNLHSTDTAWALQQTMDPTLRYQRNIHRDYNIPPVGRDYNQLVETTKGYPYAKVRQ